MSNSTFITKMEEKYIKYIQEEQDFSSAVSNCLETTKASFATELDSIRQELKHTQTVAAEADTGFLVRFKSKYTDFVSTLDSGMQNITDIDKQIKVLENNSKDIELIALNAMVISIKSGDSGRAFSRITENLNRLSSGMIEQSKKLSDANSVLLDNISRLKTLFSTFINCQQQIYDTLSLQEPLISSAITEFDIITQTAEESFHQFHTTLELFSRTFLPPAVDSDTWTRLKQKLQQITVELFSASVEEQLDSLSLKIELIPHIKKEISSIIAVITDRNTIIKNEWQKIEICIQEIEEKQATLRHLFSGGIAEDKAGKGQVALQKFHTDLQSESDLMKELSQYQSCKKNTYNFCHKVTENIQSAYQSFLTLQTVINRLQHVRVLQEIEVSKNDAIVSVKDFVTDMDNLITGSSTVLDSIQIVLENFMEEIDDMVSAFSENLAYDNKEMNDLRSRKILYFSLLGSVQKRLIESFSSAEILPVQDIARLQSAGKQYFSTDIIDAFHDFLQQLTGYESKCVQQKQELMKEHSCSTWNIRNPAYIQIIADTAGNASPFQPDNQNLPDSTDFVDINDFFT